MTANPSGCESCGKKMEKQTKGKIIKWTAIILTAINIILVFGFFVYLYFWVKARG